MARRVARNSPGDRLRQVSRKCETPPTLTFEILDDQAWFRGARPHWGARLRDGSDAHPEARVAIYTPPATIITPRTM